MTKKENDELDAAIAQLRKEYGDRTVARLGDQEIVPVAAVSTGILSMDLALGCGGFPRGRISEVYGPPSQGKTTLLLHAIAETQRAGGQALFLDAEAALDPTWAAALGVDTARLIVAQPDYGEQGLEILHRCVESNVDLAVIDSVTGLVPKAELEGEMGEPQMGLQARLMSQACRKLAGDVARHEVAVIFINQTREKIGVMFGDPTTTTGGNALKFWSSVRVDVRRTQTVKEGDLAVGIHVRARVVKNKVAPPFQEAEFDVYSGICRCHARGADRAADLLDLAERRGVVEKKGSWYSFGGERLEQGRTPSAAMLAENRKLAEAIRREILKGFGNPKKEA